MSAPTHTPAQASLRSNDIRTRLSAGTFVKKLKIRQLDRQLSRMVLISKTVLDEIEDLQYHEVHTGQFAPPRPTEADLGNRKTLSGSLVLARGIVVQRGASGSVWLRIGCGSSALWNRSWLVLKELLEQLQTQSRRSQRPDDHRPAHLYVAVSVQAVHTLDYSALAQMGFCFHHFRPAAIGKSNSSGGSAASSKQACGMLSERSTAEFVYSDSRSAPEPTDSVAGIFMQSDFDSSPVEAAAWKQRAADSWKALYFGEA